MMENKSNARWIAIVGGLFFVSACAACLILTVLLSSAYGGETVRLRNPFAPPTLAVAQQPTGDNTGNNSGNAGGGSSDGGATTGGNTGSTGGLTGGNTGSTGGNTGSTGGASNGGSVPVSGNASEYLPSLSGYTTADASSIEGALNLVLGSDFGAQSADGDTFSAQSVSISGIAATVLVSRLDEFVQCYQDSGAVDGRVYIRADLATIAAGGIPPMGAVVVANNDRLRENIVACAVSPNDPGSFSAQSANEPCGNFGTFTANNDSFTYVYAGTSSAFCSAIESYFGGFTG